MRFDLDSDYDEPDRGYFPAGKSVLRKVHRHRIVGALYGQRALLMQAADPLTFAGFIVSTNSLEEPFQRLARTAKAMETVFFGTKAQADQLTAGIRSMHAHARGVLEVDAGPCRAGTPYAADDPELALWVLACLADSALAVYRRLVGSLSRQELQMFWSEYRIVGNLFGIPDEAMPADYRSFRAYMRQRLDCDSLFVSDQARQLGRKVVLAIPLPLYAALATPVIDFAVVGLLPDRIRRLYELPWMPEIELAFKAMALHSRLTMPFVPGLLKRGSSALAYDFVAQMESSRCINN